MHINVVAVYWKKVALELKVILRLKCHKTERQREEVS